MDGADEAALRRAILCMLEGEGADAGGNLGYGAGKDGIAVLLIVRRFIGVEGDPCFFVDWDGSCRCIMY